MQKIGGIVANNVGEQAPDLIGTIAMRRIHGLFGNAFADKYRTNQFVKVTGPNGTERNVDRGAAAAKIEWTRALAGYTLAQVNRAIDMIEKSDRREPPSLPEFLGVLRTCRDAGGVARLENPDIPSQEEGREKIAEIRAKYLSGAIERGGDNALNRLMDACYTAFRDACNDAEAFPHVWKGVAE